MIDFIEGTVEGKAPGELVLCAGGVGFLLLCSNSTLAQAPARGEKWRCYTVLNVREDAMELFGFATRQERGMFRRLCQVTGVGAKTALGCSPLWLCAICPSPSSRAMWRRSPVRRALAKRPRSACAGIEG